MGNRFESLRIVALCGALGACQAVDPHAVDTQLTREVAAPATMVAWLIADVGRESFRNADPLPEHAGAPVIRTADGYEVEFSGDTTIRVGMNGRIAPPTIRIHGRYPRLARMPFEPIEVATRAQSGPIELHASIRPIGDLHCHLELSVQGGLREQRMLGHIERALHALERALRTDGTLAFDDCCPHHRQLSVPARVRASVEHEDAGRLPAARHELEQAVAHAPSCLVLRARLARLDERLARVDDAARQWRYLAESESLGLVARALSRRAQRAHDVLAAGDRSYTELEIARTYLAAGDPAAARAWSTRSMHGDDPALRAIEVRCGLERARGDHRTAFALGISELGATSTPGEVAMLAEDTVRFGDPAVGLRILARFLPDATGSDAAIARFALQRCSEVAGDELTSRVLSTERRPGLGARALLAWRYDDATTDGIAFFERITTLRERASRSIDDVAKPSAAPEYEGAPGVAAPGATGVASPPR